MNLAGTLTGPRDSLTFSGTVRHQDPTGLASLARGVVQLDLRGERAAFATDLAFDSLVTEAIRPSYPVPLAGAYAGDVRVRGDARHFTANVDLTGPHGRFVGGH